MTFKNLNLHPSLIQSLDELGFEKPTPIQELAIPHILEGKDVRASAQTGTGKTAAFLLPALHRFITTPSETGGKNSGPRILILVPTRELAMQVAAQATKYSGHVSKMRTVCIYGGAPYPIQNRDLSRPYEILVATPGRLIDHLERGRIRFSRLEMLVLDEADRMLDMGFIGPVEEIAAATPKGRQTLLFSATMKGSVLDLSKKLLTNPLELAVSPEAIDQKSIEQRLYPVDDIAHKYRLLDHLLEEENIDQAIVFTSTKMLADQVADSLYEKGVPAAALHGDMNQRERTRTVARLRRKEIQVLVATDVAARGIDIQTITHVFNFDLPMSAEDYVHRIGRTGRAGATGTALSFASGKDRSIVREIEKLTAQKFAPSIVAGLEPKKTFEERRPSAPNHRKKFFGRKKPFARRRFPS